MCSWCVASTASGTDTEGTRSRSWLRTAPVALVIWGGALAYAGCTAKDSDTVEDLPASVCPSCGPSAGGESGDFPGTPDICTRFRSPIELDDEGARALGHDVAEVRRQLSRSFDLPFFWGDPARRLLIPSEDDNARYEVEPASGYTLDDTTIALRFQAADGVLLERLHPVLCDGTTCRDDAVSVPQEGCQPILRIGVQVELETNDGAVRGTLGGLAMVFGNLGLRVLASADLEQISGKLRLSPRTDLGAHTGELSLAVEFKGEYVSGTLSPTIRFGTATGESATVYEPITGQFRGKP